MPSLEAVPCLSRQTAFTPHQPLLCPLVFTSSASAGQLWEASGPSARMVLLGKFAQDCEGRGSLYQKTKFRYGLYEFALLRYQRILID